jgi:hypothetical protein
METKRSTSRRTFLVHRIPAPDLTKTKNTAIILPELKLINEVETHGNIAGKHSVGIPPNEQ